MRLSITISINWNSDPEPAAAPALGGPSAAGAFQRGGGSGNAAQAAWAEENSGRDVDCDLDRTTTGYRRAPRGPAGALARDEARLEPTGV